MVTRIYGAVRALTPTEKVHALAFVEHLREGVAAGLSAEVLIERERIAKLYIRALGCEVKP